MAKQYYANEDPIGKQVAFARADKREWITIVGVVSNIKEFGPDTDAEPVLYTPIQQKLEPWRRWSGIIVRGPDMGQLSSGIKQAVWAIDPEVPVTKILPMTDLMAATLAQRRFTTLLLTLFAVTALALAVIGIYGVIAYSVVQRTREIGVRMALGAQRRQVVWMVLRQALLLGIVGVTLGAVGSYFASRALTSMVFGISPRDPGTFSAVAMLLLTVALLASLVPAWRATRIDPSAALRAE
jgi:putative ABC transport system permease protein